MHARPIHPQPARAAVAASLLLLALVLIGGAWIGGPARAHAAPSAAGVETVVVADPADPYYPLAAKIAQAEQLQVVAEFEQAMALAPRFILLVAAPQNLSLERLGDIGRRFQSADHYAALGIITASTMDKAEQLWARRDLARAGRDYLGTDAEADQLIAAPTIYDLNSGGAIALNKESLIAALQQADYFYWSRHVGPKTWYWNSESGDYGPLNELRAGDVPTLGPIVIYTPSCDSLRPWTQDSIALAFVDRGAAAYIGHANSPIHPGFLRRGLAVPGPLSWKGFPLGVVAQVQSKMTTRAIFTSPQFYMLGDPRLYLSQEQPYRVVSDVADGGRRVIVGESSASGVLPIRVAGGARYDYLKVVGVTAASERDLFYNSRLQTLNLGADKYLLLLHQGGGFRIELAERAPFGWIVADTLADAFDYSWVTLWLNPMIIGAPFISKLSLAIFALILLIKLAWRKRPLGQYRGALLAGAALALVRLAYFLLRRESVTVCATHVEYSAAQIAAGCLGVWANVAGGLILLRDAKKAIGRLLGLILAVLPQFLLAGFYIVYITFMNTAIQITPMEEMWLCNYNTLWLALIVLAFEIALILALHRAMRAGKEAPAPAPQSE